jgi:hypothetical protein
VPEIIGGMCIAIVVLGTIYSNGEKTTNSAPPTVTKAMACLHFAGVIRALDCNGLNSPKSVLDYRFNNCL